MSQSTKKIFFPADITRLSSVQLLRKDSVVVANLPRAISNKKILSKYKYFGQYGHIDKILISKNSQNSFNATISYESIQEAALALIAIDSFKIDGRPIAANYPVTRYCNYYLNNKDCTNKDCMFVHEISDGVNTVEISSQKVNSKSIALKILEISNEQCEALLSKQNKAQNEDNSNLISFPQISLDLLNTSDNDDNMEYVLVREPRQVNRGKAFKKRKRYYKFNRKMTDYNDSSKDIIRNFGDSIGNSRTNEKFSHRKLTYDSGIMFKRNDRSRFDFVKGDNMIKNEHCVDIPEFVYDIIDEKINKFFSSEKKEKNATKSIDKNVEVAWRDIILGKE